MPSRKHARPCRCAATATSRGAACPSSPPAPAAASFRRRLRQPRPRPAARSSSPPAPGAASARWRRCCVRLLRCCRPRRRRPQWPRPARLSASLLWTSSLPRPSPQVTPTSTSALQASKFYSGKAAESTSNNAQCCDKENELVPLQRENRSTIESLDPILMQICKIAKPGNVHEKFIGAISSVNSPKDTHVLQP